MSVCKDTPKNIQAIGGASELPAMPKSILTTLTCSYLRDTYQLCNNKVSNIIATYTHTHPHTPSKAIWEHTAFK